LELAKGHAGRQDISGFLEVFYCKIREARGERFWKRTLFFTLYSQYFNRSYLQVHPLAQEAGLH
jgi:hypothetical protein